MELKYIVEIDEIVIKDYLEQKGLSRRIRRKLRTLDNIYVNGQKQKNYYVLHLNDELVLVFNEILNDEIAINSQELDIVYEDDQLLIINKPDGLSSQPSKKHPKDNMISIIKNYFLNNNIDSNIHLVNRLDLDTTGLMIVAKNGLMHHFMSEVEILKEYICEIEGHITPTKGTINLPIDRYPAPDIRRFVGPNGKKSITHYETLVEKEDTSILLVRLQTGRTHQIRVHMSHLGHPLLGDILYGSQAGKLKLHCYHLMFIHPNLNISINMKNYPVWYQGGNIDA